MDNQNTQDYSQYCKAMAMDIYGAVAVINAIETMAEHHADGESSKCLSDIALLAENARKTLHAVTDDLDRNTGKYQLIDSIV